MSESPAPPAAPPAVPAPVAGTTEDALAAGTAQWEAMLASYAKQPGGGMGFPGVGVGGVPFSMAPFAQPFMYPGFMLPGFGFGALPGAEGGEGKAANGEEEGSGEDDTEDEDDDDEDDEGDSSDKEGGRPKRKRAARGAAAKKAKPAAEGGMGVKSNSSAALAMLAGAAASKPPNPAAAAAAAAAMQQNLGELWGTLNGGAAAAMGGPAASLDMSKLTTEQQQMLHTAGFDVGGHEGMGDEREVKRMRRKQSNRESARRSRLRKQAECEQLGRQVKELVTENSRLKEEKLQLLAQIEILNAKLSMSSAFGAVHALGAGDLEKIQADLRAKQTQDMQNMAAAMAQAMQVNGGGMMGAGLGIPSLDAKPLEADDTGVVGAVPVVSPMDGVNEQQVQGGSQ